VCQLVFFPWVQIVHKLSPLKNWAIKYALFLFVLSGYSLMAQETSSKKIRIQQADKGYYSKASGKNRLVGDVIFEHDGALMYCDSAWFFSAENRIKAFRSVKVNQGDSLFLWGDQLEYSGETKQALVTGKEVKLQDSEMTLITDRLRLDRNTNISYYTTGGIVTNEENVLLSEEGYYNSNYKVFSFKDSVVLSNPDYLINTDTMDYDSESHVAYFFGPTTIDSDSSKIYCENGRYDTDRNIAQFNKNAYLYDGPKYLTGDSLYYERDGEYGEAFGHVLIHDTIEDYLISGEYGEYFGTTDSAYVTGEPLYTAVDEEKDSLFVHGDTLYSSAFTDSLGKKYRRLTIFYGVRFFKNEMQGSCDSLGYSTMDTTFRMYRDPLIWDDSTQISGDTIYMSTIKNKPDTLKVLTNAFMISFSDSLRFNQVAGRRMIGKFKNGELSKVFVNGNGEAIYYPKEEDGDYMGMNRSICSNILIRFKDSEVRRITWIGNPEGIMHPMDKIPEDRKKLEGFNPRFEERPRSKADLFK
jgi:lipopolysaccharide export system protein LptA